MPTELTAETTSLIFGTPPADFLIQKKKLDIPESKTSPDKTLWNDCREHGREAKKRKGPLDFETNF